MAATTAQKFPRLGGYIAAVDAPVETVLEPFPGVPEHQTAYGDPDAFVRSVVDVVRAG